MTAQNLQPNLDNRNQWQNLIKASVRDVDLAWGPYSLEKVFSKPFLNPLSISGMGGWMSVQPNWDGSSGIFIPAKCTGAGYAVYISACILQN